MPRNNCIVNADEVRLIRRTHQERYPHLGAVKASRCLHYYFPQLRPGSIRDIITRHTWKDIE